MCETTTEVAVKNPEILAEQAEAIFSAGDPDSPPEVRIKSAYRDLSCKGSGPECYRRVLYPGKTETEWPNGERLPASGIRASERRATVYTTVPVGTIVQDFERDVYKNQRGKCRRSYGIVGRKSDGTSEITWMNHRVLRIVTKDEVELPSGQKIRIDRPER